MTALPLFDFVPDIPRCRALLKSAGSSKAHSVSVQIRAGRGVWSIRLTPEARDEFERLRPAEDAEMGLEAI